MFGPKSDVIVRFCPMPLPRILVLSCSCILHFACGSRDFLHGASAAIGGEPGHHSDLLVARLPVAAAARPPLLIGGLFFSPPFLLFVFLFQLWHDVVENSVESQEWRSRMVTGRSSERSLQNLSRARAGGMQRYDLVDCHGLSSRVTCLWTVWWNACFDFLFHHRFNTCVRLREWDYSCA